MKVDEVKRLKQVLPSILLILVISSLTIRTGVSTPTAILALDPSTCSGWIDPNLFSHTYLKITVSDVENVYNFQVHVMFDQTVLQVVGAYEGGFLQGNPTDVWESGPWDDANVGGLDVLNPLSAHDRVYGAGNWDSTYASFNYSQVDGYFAVGNFSKEEIGWDNAANRIQQVDLKIRYSASASVSSDQYRIVYYVGGGAPSSEIVLVDWTSAASSLQTHVWADIEEPTDGEWDWNDLWAGIQGGLHVAVETDRVIGDPNASFELYEVWASVTYTRPTFTVAFSPAAGQYVMAVTTLEAYPGMSGSGVLGILEFLVIGSGNTAITMFPANSYLTDPNDVLITRSLVNSQFYEPIPEDVNGDARIDIFDLSWIGINYAQSPPFNPPQVDVYPIGSPDGAVDIYDLATVAIKYGYVYP